ncbi:MAG: translation elongation factor Ts [Rickettsiales bacterium]|jgi:elongation factor Ts|nr:translation elongation factor Ts [Rickettsiales bacterium]
MAEITAEQVKQLRGRTGAGILDAKKALVETGGDMEKAVDVLRAKGLAKAAQKGGREALAGAVALRVEGNKGVIIEVNSETDFVARNEKFQAFVSDVLKASKGAVPVKINGVPADEAVAGQIAAIGEKIALGRADSVEVENGAVIAYIHNRLADGMGLIGVLLGIESSAPEEKIREVGEQVAMHVAAAAPLFLDVSDVDEASASREKAVAREKAIASGKPAEIAEKMVAGSLKKYYDEVVLNEQAFFIDPSKKIKDVVASIGGGARIAKFVRFQIGK